MAEKNKLAGNKLQLSLLLKWQIMVRTIFSYTAIGLRVSLYICIVERPFIYLFAILYRSYTITKKVQLEKVCLSVYYLRSIKMLTIAIVRGNYTTYFDCNSMSSQDYKCQLSATNQFMIILKYKLNSWQNFLLISLTVNLILFLSFKIRISTCPCYTPAIFCRFQTMTFQVFFFRNLVIGVLNLVWITYFSETYCSWTQILLQ